MRSPAALLAITLAACTGSTAPEPATATPTHTQSTQALWDPPYTPVPENPPDPPRYKPSGKTPEPIPITTDAYGFFSAAPDAPALGDVAEDFTIPIASGGTFDLAQARAAGPVLLMFYRGFW